MSSLGYAIAAALGTFLIWTGADAGSDARARRRLAAIRSMPRRLLDQAGLNEVTPQQFVIASACSAVVASLPAIALFGPGVPAVFVAAIGGSIPTATWRQRRAARRRAAADAWPRLIEELRVLTGSVGRSIPQALIEVGLAGPPELRPAFVAAQREWALTTDFGRTVETLKCHLADATADATCETLLIAAEVGGDIDARLRALADDRRQDLLGRKEAAAKQAGARFARTFVILVPAGMALAGLSVGDGRQAYLTGQGQVLVAVGIGLVVACWAWASRIMRVPPTRRVFDR